jgi:hypothetical protein
VFRVSFCDKFPRKFSILMSILVHVYGYCRQIQQYRYLLTLNIIIVVDAGDGASNHCLTVPKTKILNKKILVEGKNITHPKCISFVKYLLWRAFSDSFTPVWDKDVIILTSFILTSRLPQIASFSFCHDWKSMWKYIYYYIVILISKTHYKIIVLSWYHIYMKNYHYPHMLHTDNK